MQKIRRFKRKETLVVLFALLMGLALIYSPFAMTWETQAAGTITGQVFQDYNGNGSLDTIGGTAAADKGVAGVTVTAYDSSGAAQGSTTTLANGTYSLAATGTGPYRVEFTTLPANYQSSARSTDSVNGGTATNAGSTVQFVLNGNTANVNVAINRPADFCQDNPLLVTTCFVGTVTGNPANPDNPVVISFPYNSGTTSTASSSGVHLPLTHALMVPQSQAGSVWGIAQHRRSQQVFTTAFTKRHAAFRNDIQGSASNDPTGEIFVTNRAGTTASVFLNLNTLFGSNIAGNNPHDVTNPNPGAGNSSYFSDTPAFDAVGKTALGDVDISDDEQTLFVVNMADRNLYAIPIGAGTPTAPTSSAAVSVYNLVTLAGASATCPASADLRPGALKVSNGTLYYGLTCTAQTSGTAANLRAFVYSLNLSGTGTATQVANIPLNYPRGFLATDFGAPAIEAPAEWQTWTNDPTQMQLFAPSGAFYRPQPWLLDIEFDKNNFMIVGLADRAGHQLGNDRSLTNPATEPVETVSGGDTLRLSPGAGTWTLESNSSDGTNSTLGVNTGEGPGPGPLPGPANFGEFYYQDGYTINNDTHQEITLGGMLNVPGFNDVLVAAFDPAPTNSNPDTGLSTVRSGGVIWLNNTTGARSRSYQLYSRDDTDNSDAFGKAAGIGDIEAFCNAAPIEIGNRVWSDLNSNGVQDPGEEGIAGVTVRLYKNNVLVGTAVTDANGEYYFVGGTAADPNTNDNIGIVNGGILPNMAYEVRMDNLANYQAGGPLANLLITQQDQTSQLGFDEGSDSDAGPVINPAGSPAGTFAVIPVTTGIAGQNNHNIDAGFAPAANFSIGNRVWFDTNNDGQINAGEVGISGVSVSLLNGGGAVVGGPINTDANGYYRFDGLAAGNYTVRINASNFANGAILAGHNNTTITDGSDTDSTIVPGQNGENGINPTGPANGVQTTGISSGTITLAAPSEPTGEVDLSPSGQGTIDTAANMTVDFGFYCLEISGTLWLDNGAGAGGVANDGIFNGTEPRLPLLRMRLFTGAGVEVPVGNDGILGTSDDASNSFSADTNGNYSFRCLPPGDYRVVVDRGGDSSTPTFDPNLNIDSDDSGAPGTGPFVGSTVSGVFTITPGFTGNAGNTVVTNANGRTSDPTIDFGFVTAPTLVKLENFKVFTNGVEVSIEWSTGEEFNNLGFNVYREVNGKRELLTNSPIAGSALRTNANLVATGESYRWQDSSPKAGAVYYLEDIDINGKATINGPVYPEMKYFRSANVNPLEKMNSPQFSDMTGVVNPSAQREFILAKGAKTASERFGNGLEATQWEIAGQNGAKISVSRDGWYHLDANDLVAAKFDIATDKTTWQLYAGAVQVPMKVGTDGSIDFYGQGLDIPTTDTRTYYLVYGDSPGLRVNQVDGGNAGNTQVAPNFEMTVERKDRVTAALAILNGEEENWFGPIINSGGQTIQDLTVNNIDANSLSRLSVKLQGFSTTEHQVNVRFNDVSLGSVTLNGRENQTFDFDLPANTVIEGTNRVTLQENGSTASISFVDTVRLTYARRYQAADEKLQFSVPAGQSVRFSGFNSEDVSLFEIGNNGRVNSQIVPTVENSGGAITFSLAAVSYDREMLAIGDLSIETADMVERNMPSSLNASSNQADFVIIAPSAIQKYTWEMAGIRRDQGMRTKVVSVEDIYDEFSFGVHSPEAIRSFLERATTTWNVQPQYVLMFGDSSFDPRNYLGQTDLDLIPTKLVETEFMETASDSWLADFNNDGIEDIAIGRMPVSNEDDAEIMVGKWIGYHYQTARQTRSSVMVADTSFESYNEILEANLPDDVQVTRIDRINLSNSKMRESIITNLNSSPQVVTFTGHGSSGLWMSQDVFSLTDVSQVNNEKLSLYLLMTCLNGLTNSPYNVSMAEALAKSPTGGASLVWASSGLTYPTTQFEMTQVVTNLVFNSAPNARVGDMIIGAKQATQDQDVRRTWQLIGDPTAVIK